ncbi:MAG: thioredoxin family protein [bacterium]
MKAKSLIWVAGVILLAVGAWSLRQQPKQVHPSDSEQPRDAARGVAETQPENRAGQVNLAGEDRGLAARLGVPAGKPAMVDFGSLNCIPCIEMDKNMSEARPKVGDAATIMFVNVYEQQEQTKLAGISIIPTQIFFDAQGNETWRHVGVLTVDEIVARLTGPSGKNEGGQTGGSAKGG